MVSGEQFPDSRIRQKCPTLFLQTSLIFYCPLLFLFYVNHQEDSHYSKKNVVAKLEVGLRRERYSRAPGSTAQGQFKVDAYPITKISYDLKKKDDWELKKTT